LWVGTGSTRPSPKGDGPIDQFGLPQNPRANFTHFTLL